MPITRLIAAGTAERAAPAAHVDETAVFRIAFNARITDQNSASVTALGDLAGQVMGDVFPGRDIAELDEHCFARRWPVRLAGGDVVLASVFFVPQDDGWLCLLPGLDDYRELHDGEAFLKMLMDAILGGVCVCDAQRFRFVNNGFAELLGYSVNELVGSSYRERLALHTRRRLEALMTGGENIEDRIHEVTLLTRESNRREALMRFRRVQVNGEWLLIGVAVDVTNVRRSERMLQDYAHRLRRVSQQVIEIQENERRNLARELHDEIGQQLTLLKLMLTRSHGREDGVDLSEAIGTVSQLLQQVRDLSLDLRPSMLDDLGLASTLRWYAERVARLALLDVKHEISPDFPRLRTDAETLIFRVAQEAITNVMRHAGASHLRVALLVQGNVVQLVIEDDGRGFDIEAARRRALEGGSAGLLGMQERAAFAGAEFSLESQAGGGTRLVLTLSADCVEESRAGVAS